MSIPATRVFTPRELVYLGKLGYQPDRVYPSTGEALTYVNDQPYAFTVATLKCLANPRWRDRLRNTLANWAA